MRNDLILPVQATYRFLMVRPAAMQYSMQVLCSFCHRKRRAMGCLQMSRQQQALLRQQPWMHLLHMSHALLAVIPHQASEAALDMHVAPLRGNVRAVLHLLMVAPLPRAGARAAATCTRHSTRTTTRSRRRCRRRRPAPPGGAWRTPTCRRRTTLTPAPRRAWRRRTSSRLSRACCCLPRDSGQPRACASP